MTDLLDLIRSSAAAAPVEQRHPIDAPAIPKPAPGQTWIWHDGDRIVRAIVRGDVYWQPPGDTRRINVTDGETWSALALHGLARLLPALAANPAETLPQRAAKTTERNRR